MEADKWWRAEPYERLLVQFSNEPSSFGDIAWGAGLWKTPTQRTAAWDALGTLTATGLVERTDKGWIATGPLADFREASIAAENDYFNRLYDKAIAVGDITEGDENFCGDCCYQYDDVEPLDDVMIRDGILSSVRLSPAPSSTPDVNLTASTMRAMLGEGMLLVIVVPLIVVGVVSAFVWFALGWLAEGVVRIARRM